jgi:hypothetical protein
MSLPLVGGAGDASRPLFHCTRFWLTVQLEKGRSLLDTRARLAREDRVLAIVCPPGPVRRLFELVGRERLPDL